MKAISKLFTVFSMIGLFSSSVMADEKVNVAKEAPPKTELVMEITADIAPPVNLGKGPLGERAIVAILSGTFTGNNIQGTLLPGGADRQQIRQDGYKLLHATYELKTDDGVVISITNRVLTPLTRKPGEKAFSQIELIAPEGKYDWINKNVYIGTLTSLKPQRAAVLIRVYKLIP